MFALIPTFLQHLLIASMRVIYKIFILLYFSHLEALLGQQILIPPVDQEDGIIQNIMWSAEHHQL